MGGTNCTPACTSSVSASPFNSASSGPDVIIRNGTDGFLVKQNHTDQLAAKLAELMADEEKRAAFGAQAKSVTERFSLANYLDAYEKLCKDAVK